MGGGVTDVHCRLLGCVDADHIFTALHDETAREILVRTAERAYSARELADALGVSVSTVYRQLTALTEHDLVVEETKIDPGGNHHHVYRTDVERIEIDIRDGRLEAAIDRQTDAADRFTYIWEGIRE